MRHHFRNAAPAGAVVLGLIVTLLGADAMAQKAGAKGKRADQVKVHLAFEPVEFKGEMEIFEVKPRTHTALWQTETEKDEDKIPIGERIEKNTFEMRPGSTKRMVLVMRNPTKETKYFFAAPHVVDPPVYSLGFKFKCLCINHAFSIPPGEIWYRVVELRMDKDFVGDAFEIKHSLIGLDAARAKEFELKAKKTKGGHSH